ncbi:MAG: ParB/RepB/Spo0J family partition protein [Treponema sp.]|nr:ParB/RepB/Spo0J family partition protein [Treponema sp.]
MAKKFGLGNGVNALFKNAPKIAEPKAENEKESAKTEQTEQKSEQKVEQETEQKSEPAKIEQPSFDIVSKSENSSAISSSEKSENPAQKKNQLPDGISSDEFGQLFVNVNLLKPNPQQPRTEFDEDKLNELAESIREHGIHQPIEIEDAGDGNFYIISGERRTRAAKIVGLEKVPVRLGKFESDQEKLEIALIENIQRADLNDIEEAKAYYKLMQISGLSQDQIAARVGKNRSTVANAIRLLKLPEDMQNALVEGNLTAGHARALLAVKDSNDRRVLFKKIIDGGMVVRKAEELANELNNGEGSGSSKRKLKSPLQKDPGISEIEQKFMEIFGTKVVLNGTLEKGKIEIDYFSKADLDRLYSLIVK